MNTAQMVGEGAGAACVAEVWNVLGTTMLCKIASEETGGAYSVLDNVVGPQGGPPPHRHENEDEVFYVLEGEFEINYGGQTVVARKGDVVAVGKGVTHSFRNVGAGEGRLLVTITPGGFERFFEEVSREQIKMPQDAEKLAALSRKYGLEFLM